jgi:predicted ATPase
MEKFSRKTMDAKHYLLSVSLNRKEIADFHTYPYNIAAVKSLNKIYFNPNVTFIVGENGAGKSTLIEAISISCGFNPEGGSRNFNFSTKETHSELYKHISVQKGLKRPSDGFFLRAESFYNVASNIDNELAAYIDAYGGQSLHKMSHGESFFALMLNRFRGKGLYILDEPEAALSPTRQLTMLARIHELVEMGSQFIISTHSPILMAYPDSTIFMINENGINEVNYEETEHFIITKQFLNNRQSMIRELFKD